MSPSRRDDGLVEGNSPFELDLLYNDIDKCYHGYARGCGLSDCAYWMMYDLELGGGSRPIAELTTVWAYSKQTINSALKSLKEQGYVTIAFMEGSRKSKVASFTDEGRAFSARFIVPAIEAEERAFNMLSAAERRNLVRLVRKYAGALETQFSPDSFADAVGDAAKGV